MTRQLRRWWKRQGDTRATNGAVRTGSHTYSRPLRLEPLEDRRLLAITVDTLVDEADGSIADGDISLRDAIALAPPNETIDFDPALTSGGPATINLTLAALLIDKPLSIIGPGADLLTIDSSGNDPTPELKNGDGRRVLNIDDSTSTRQEVLIQGLTLTGGDVSGIGGAISSTERLMIHETVIHNNAGSNGGAIFSSGPLMVFDSEIRDNQGFVSGGGIQVDLISNFSLQIIRTSILDNTALNRGGGVFATLTDGTFVVTDSLILGNEAGMNGGGIATTGRNNVQVNGRLTLTGSSVIDNHSDADGGGIHATGNITIDKSLVFENSADNGGGLFAGGAAEITRSSFVENSAAIGGGLVIGGSGSVLTQVTVSGNDALLGGGGLFASQPLEIRHSTIANNQADSNDMVDDQNETGGGILYLDAIDPTSTSRYVLLDHTIVADNFRSVDTPDDLSSGDLDEDGNYFALQYALVETDSNFFQHPDTDFEPFMLGVDPLLNELGDNNGVAVPGDFVIFTQTLMEGSPAIDAGDPDSETGGGNFPEFDQRDDPHLRLVDGTTGDTPGRIDLGAVEFVPTIVPDVPGDYNGDGTNDAADYVIWRMTVGSEDDLRADGSGTEVGVPDGVVDDLDYDYWLMNFGSTQGAGSGSSSAMSLRAVSAPQDAPARQVSEVASPVESAVVPVPYAPAAQIAATSQAIDAVHSQPTTTSTSSQDTLLAAWVAATVDSSHHESEVSDHSSADGDADDSCESSPDAFDGLFGRLGSDS